MAASAPTAGAAGDAEHVGIGQRIAQQHLHQRAGQRQQAAAGEGGQRARQAQLADDRRAGAAIVAVVESERMHDGREIDRHAALVNASPSASTAIAASAATISATVRPSAARRPRGGRGGASEERSGKSWS